MAPELAPQAANDRWLRMGGALSAVALAAACSGSAGVNSETPQHTGLPSASPERFPSPSASEALSGCGSIRAVQPGGYFNKSYKDHIAGQLDLLRAAYSPDSNVDIDHDLVFRYLPMLHAMENDPMYATAIKRAAVRIKKDPKNNLSAGQLLTWDIPESTTCAPERISDLDSARQLAQTGDVGFEVGTALLSHLRDQASRGTHMLKIYLTGVMEAFDKHLDKKLRKLDMPQISRE